MYITTYQDGYEPLFISNSLDSVLDFLDGWTGASEFHGNFSHRLSYTELNKQMSKSILFAIVIYRYNNADMECINYNIWKLDEK